LAALAWYFVSLQDTIANRSSAHHIGRLEQVPDAAVLTARLAAALDAA